MNKDNCCGGHEQPDKKTEEKLHALEESLATKKCSDLPAAVSSQELIKSPSQTPLKDDLYYFGGIALVAFALLTLFQHVRVGTGILQALGLGGGQGIGLLLLPLLAGIGLIIYNSKNKLGYIVVSLTCAIIFYAILAGLIMSFPSMSFLGLIIMLAPLGIGGAFIVKGLGGPKGIEYRLREKGFIKSEIKSINQSK